jgi:hypothetical protein
MTQRPRAAAVRNRLYAALPGLVLFTAFGAWYSTPWEEPWFFVGVGMMVSATFVEPFFTKPQDAIVNGAAGIGAVASLDTAPVAGLWIAWLVVLGGIVGAGLTATVSPGESGTMKWVGFQVASRLGRAVVVGTTTLSLVVLGAAAAGDDHFEFLAAGSALLAAALAIDWHGVLTRIVRRKEAATALAAIGPRMLLVAATSSGFEKGEPIRVQTASGAVGGSIVSRLPHSHGLRYQIALGAEWSSLFSSFPEEGCA